ncbi:hypothetical protein LWC35_19135 [Pseudonocardia kujensis]|uniref:hypothetical protein n=1 Tax=Pseudonocardia kujensis TaxID=1128675 RepID=UPI001E31638A|nr:hypothetical protein [Pseudonocardia kujensis]MCE0764998.1 hypothetical protein [Pseudonocardia kujensis]
MLATGLAAVAGLVWAVIAFLNWDPPIKYNEATTQEAVAAQPDCAEIGRRHQDDDVTQAQRYDVTAQMELQARNQGIGMVCDENVQATCNPSSSCLISYGDEQLTLRVIHGTCYTIADRLCHYRLQPENRLLAQRRVNEGFAAYASKQREDGAILRCDTIPGGADLFPASPRTSSGDLDDSAGPDPTGYRCYSREPGHITYLYDVLLLSNGTAHFQEVDD